MGEPGNGHSHAAAISLDSLGLCMSALVASGVFLPVQRSEASGLAPACPVAGLPAQQDFREGLTR